MASSQSVSLEVDAPHGHDHDHAHPPHLKHYFVSSEQQFDAAKMGMWLFLMTEILLFSGMFVAYAIYRAWHPEVFQAAALVLDTTWGFVNTLVLLGSSLTVALSIHYVQKGDQKKLILFLALTLLGAFIFLVIKYFEYTGKFAHGIVAGSGFAPFGGEKYDALNIPYAQQFFAIYFVATGIHAVHIIAGIAVLGWVLYKSTQGAFTPEYYTPVELGGLYWHLVDIIWIFLFPLLYLIH